MPSYPSDDKEEGYEIYTANFKLVADYTGFNFEEIRNLEIDDFLTYQRDAFIRKMNSTEEGRQYLDDCKRLNTTKADYKKLLEKKKGG